MMLSEHLWLGRTGSRDPDLIGNSGSDLCGLLASMAPTRLTWNEAWHETPSP
jgi:hypothetical protein